MHLLRLIDSRTVILCRCLIAIVLTVVFLTIRKLYPSLRGVGSVAAGFFLIVPFTLLLASRDIVPQVFTVVGANLLGCLSYLFLYRAVLRFCHDRGALPWLYAAITLLFAIMVYDGVIVNRIVPRIVAMALFMAFSRILIAWALFRHATGRVSMYLFGTTLVLAALIYSSRAIVTLIHGASGDFLRGDALQTSAQMFSLIVLCLDGVFYLAIFIGSINETVQEHAQLDFLTGTMSRRGAEDALSAEIARSRRTEGPIAVLLADIDKFKTLNDCLGHIAGDEALRVVACSIASVLRPYDKLGRFGNDEFLLVLPEASSDHGMDVARRIREALQSLAQTTSAPPITVSIGVTHCIDQEEPGTVLARADAALLEARQNGRDTACCILPTEHDKTVPRVLIPRASLLSRVNTRRRPSGLFY